jgi:hypothetical protein
MEPLDTGAVERAADVAVRLARRLHPGWPMIQTTKMVCIAAASDLLQCSSVDPIESLRCMVDADEFIALRDLRRGFHRSDRWRRAAENFG